MLKIVCKSLLPLSSAVLGLVLVAQPVAAAETTGTKKSDALSTRSQRYAADFKKFEQQDEKETLGKGGVLFVGSSSIRGWDLDKAFPDIKLRNRGFGGSNMPDVLEHFERVISPHNPSIVVLYSGDNDISGGRTPEQVVQDMEAFVERVKKEKSSVERIIIIPPKPSASRFDKWPKMQKVAELLQGVAARHKDVVIVDMSQELLDAEGNPRPELFKADRLHLSPEGYVLWNAKLRPYLTVQPAQE